MSKHISLAPDDAENAMRQSVSPVLCAWQSGSHDNIVVVPCRHSTAPTYRSEDEDDDGLAA